MVINNFDDFMDKVEEWVKERHLHEVEFVPEDLLENIFSERQEMANAFKEDDDKKRMYEIFDAAADELIYIAVDSFKPNTSIDREVVEISYNIFCTIISSFEHYSPYIVLTEVLKEISSRKGKYDKKKGKWVKDCNQDPKTLYKANFDNALY